MEQIQGKPRRGALVSLKPSCCIYYEKSDEQLAREQEADRRAGRFFDGAGESLIYCKVGSESLSGQVVAMVTRTRGIRWLGFSSKPEGLIELFATIDGVPRIVMVPWTRMVRCNLAEA